MSLSEFQEKLKSNIDKGQITESGYNENLKAVFERGQGKFRVFETGASRPQGKVAGFFNRQIHYDDKHPKRGDHHEIVQAIFEQIGMEGKGEERKARFGLYKDTRDLLSKGQFGHELHRMSKKDLARISGLVVNSATTGFKLAMALYEPVAVAKKLPTTVPVGAAALGSEIGVHYAAKHSHGLNKVQRWGEILASLPAAPLAAERAKSAEKVLKNIVDKHSESKSPLMGEDRFIPQKSPFKYLTEILDARKILSKQEMLENIKDFGSNKAYMNALSEAEFNKALERILSSTFHPYHGEHEKFSRDPKKTVASIARNKVNSIKHSFHGHEAAKSTDRASLNDILAEILKSVGIKGKFSVYQDVQKQLSMRHYDISVPEFRRHFNPETVGTKIAGGIVAAGSISSMAALAILGGPLGIGALAVNTATGHSSDIKRLYNSGKIASAMLSPEVRQYAKKSQQNRIDIIESHGLALEKSRMRKKIQSVDPIDNFDATLFSETLPSSRKQSISSLSSSSDDSQKTLTEDSFWKKSLDRTSTGSSTQSTIDSQTTLNDEEVNRRHAVDLDRKLVAVDTDQKLRSRSVAGRRSSLRGR